VLIVETGPVAERLRVREIDDDESTKLNVHINLLTLSIMICSYDCI
jgi:hypothetical protein